MARRSILAAFAVILTVYASFLTFMVQGAIEHHRAGTSAVQMRQAPIQMPAQRCFPAETKTIFSPNFEGCPDFSTGKARA